MITPASDRALLVSFGETYSDEIHLRVRLLVRGLQKRRDLFLVDVQPAYASVLLTIDLLKTDLPTVTSAVHGMLAEVETEIRVHKAPRPRQVEIPVCYDESLAPDLAAVATHTRLAPAEVVRLHTAAEYTVCFFGFMPGFSYWSGLPDVLAVPRLAVPRVKVPAGSVGIGGTQTGIYPLETPGGWRIVGRTPLQLFNPRSKRLCFLQLGDRVRLVPIPLKEFKRQEGAWGH